MSLSVIQFIFSEISGLSLTTALKLLDQRTGDRGAYQLPATTYLIVKIIIISAVKTIRSTG